MYTIRRKSSEHQDVVVKCKIQDFLTNEGIHITPLNNIFYFLNYPVDEDYIDVEV